MTASAVRAEGGEAGKGNKGKLQGESSLSRRRVALVEAAQAQGKSFHPSLPPSRFKDLQERYVLWATLEAGCMVLNEAWPKQDQALAPLAVRMHDACSAQDTNLTEIDLPNAASGPLANSDHITLTCCVCEGDSTTAGAGG